MVDNQLKTYKSLKQAEVGQALLFKPSCAAFGFLSILRGYSFHLLTI